MVLFMNWGAWAIACALAFWMLFDLVKTDRSFDEDYLLSSAEGEIVDSEVGESAARAE
ncbi:hypothetical protein [Methylobacterium brachythecii]|uniref:Uncharacterized protein n=1 Tax=Methylobacterium brachythecii TaxID=1176177 RepID=A0A7W6F7E7_9HYPH|nr:hypothetical protein [Methylobacterium brachythecii]MBB3903288.1 hypothetical protein [Methylobacterium brachythecii]GLS46094.1 hypothetical protein GCM10007884_40850 [Methylobacterium brachythecii]